MKQRLVWRRKPKETGFYGRLHNHERGWELRAGTKVVGRVESRRPLFHPMDTGFYWCALGRNSLNETAVYATPDEAKAACKAWVVAELAKAEAEP